MNNSNYGIVVIVLAVIGGLVVLGWLLRIAFGLLPLLILVAFGVFIFFVLQRAMGGRR